MRTARRPRADERGNIAPLTVTMLFALIVVSGLVVDIALATVQQQLQTNDLAAARDDMLSAPNALMLKNAEDPGLFTAQTVVDSLRDNGYEGRVTVWYCEAGASEVPSDRRAIAWAAQTESEMPALFMAFTGVDGLETGAYVVGSALPYSHGTTWRPADTVSGRYVAVAGSRDVELAEEITDAAGLPAPLQEALNARIAEANAS